jgi:hypothetical protein
VRRGATREEFQVEVAERLVPYDIAPPPAVDPADGADAELVERAATLLTVMPRNQSRSTIEELVSPHDPDRGRRAVNALIESAFAVEDDAGHLVRVT